MDTFEKDRCPVHEENDFVDPPSAADRLLTSLDGKDRSEWTDEEQAAWDEHQLRLMELDLQREREEPWVNRALYLPRTDAGNAEFFTYLFVDLTRYDHMRNRWLVWDSHRWRADDDATVYRAALQTVRKRARAAGLGIGDTDERQALAKYAIGSESRPRQDALLALAKTMVPIADSGRGWDETPGLIGVGNGVVDLHTGELRDGRPEDRITMSTGIAFDPAAECPTWLTFLSQVLEDPEDTIPYLQRLIGYSLTGEATLHLLIFLMGTGRNGKGTIIRNLDTALGDYARVISAHAFAAERRNAHSTEVSDLASSRFAYCEELGDETLNAERLKDLSGGGTKIARRMKRDTLQFRQTWLLWFTTNKLPRSNDNSWGWWERVRAFEFPNQFLGEDADPNLDEKLAEELPGILAWVVEGARQFYADGGVEGEIPKAVEEKTAEYREDLDPLEPLVQKGYFSRCDSSIWTPTEVLFAAYKEYAGTTAIVLDHQWTERTLAGRLKDQYRYARHLVELADGSKKQFRGFHGIRPGEAATDPVKVGSWQFGEGEKTSAGAPPLPEGMA